MVHLPPLAGAPRFGGSMDEVVAHAIADAEALRDGGVDAIMMENFGDAPFTRGRVEPVTVAAMTRCAAAIVERFDLPLGINVLRNDALTALDIAHAVGASFIRVNVLTGARLTDQGIIEGDAYSLARRRRSLGADVAIWADVDVKHSAPLAERPLREEVEETIGRGHADVICVSGSGTGAEVDDERLASVVDASTVPVVLGSGVSVDNVGRYSRADGAIVGSSLKRAGLHSPVSAERVRALMTVVAQNGEKPQES